MLDSRARLLLQSYESFDGFLLLYLYSVDFYLVVRLFTPFAQSVLLYCSVSIGLVVSFYSLSFCSY